MAAHERTEPHIPTTIVEDHTMNRDNTTDRYNALSIAAHWLTLALLIVVYALIELRGIYPKVLPRTTRSGRLACRRRAASSLRPAGQHLAPHSALAGRQTYPVNWRNMT